MGLPSFNYVWLEKKVVHCRPWGRITVAAWKCSGKIHGVKSINTEMFILAN